MANCLQVERVTPCAPQFVFARTAGRELPALSVNSSLIRVYPCLSVVKIFVCRCHISSKSYPSTNRFTRKLPSPVRRALQAYQLGTDLKSWIEAGLVPAVTMSRLEELPVPFIVISAEAGIQEKECHYIHCEEGLVGTDCNNQSPFRKGGQRGILNKPPADTPPLLIELYNLLKSNPAVKIINKPENLIINRNGKYVAGRISDLVFRHPEVMEHILNHPDEEITYQNLFKGDNL